MSSEHHLGHLQAKINTKELKYSLAKEEKKKPRKLKDY